MLFFEYVISMKYRIINWLFLILKISYEDVLLGIEQTSAQHKFF